MVFSLVRGILLWLPTLLGLILTTAICGQNDTLSLDALIQEALKNNPQLHALSSQTEAARAQVAQVSWDPPQVGMEFYQTPIQSFPIPMKNGMESDYYIQQMIPFPGKLGAMGKAAENNAEMTDQSYKAVEKKIIRDLKSAYYELYFIQRKTEINAENQELMKGFVDIALKQYEVGMGKQPDILRAQTELSRLINEGINLKQEIKTAEAMINTILSRDANAALGHVPDIKEEIPEWTYEELRPLALQARPELRAMKFNITMNEAELSVAKKEYYPDFMARMMYKDMKQTGNDFWSVMIGLDIPLAFWSKRKYTAKVDEIKSRVKGAEEGYKNMENMALFEVQDAVVRVQTSKNSMLLYADTIIPQAEQTLQATISAYQTGKTEFLMLIDAYRMLLMSRLEFHMSVMNYMTSQAALEQAMGMNIREINESIR